MVALVTTVFVASLVGSLHCAGMCGVFVAFAVDPRGNDAGRRTLLQIAYNGGRLVTYTALGAIAGQAGAALDLGGGLFGIQRAALVSAGLAMVVFGTVSLLRLAGVRVGGVAPPRFLQTAFVKLQARIRNRGPVARALGTGLFSTFLPCGWLYAFAVVAAGTGSAALGAATMALFWAGTLPVMVALGVGVQRLAGPLRRHVPALTAVALVIVGLVAVSGRFAVPALAVPPEVASSEAAGVDATLERVEALSESGPACHDDTTP